MKLDSAVGGVMVQTNRIVAVLSKGLLWLWMFFLISVTIFGLALTLATLNRWPQVLIGLVIVVSPFIIWHIEKILTLACQMLRHTLGFIFRAIHKTITLIHKRKWTALLFWGGCTWWNWVLAIIIFILFRLANDKPSSNVEVDDQDTEWQSNYHDEMMEWFNERLSRDRDDELMKR
ncbi:MAG: hypothetical protein AB2988_04305 [Candidatus Symbiodolus clandestinus]